MNYPREVIINDEKLKNLIIKKSEIINIGRGLSDEIEKLESKMIEVDKEIQEEEKKVDISEFNKKAEIITEKVNQCIKEMEEVKNDTFNKLKSQVPVSLIEKYESIKKTKEEKEEERNKIALKAQKHKDKIIPLAQKLMKPLLQDEYEDYESIDLVDGELKAKIFSHLEDFKTKFKKK